MYLFHSHNDRNLYGIEKGRAGGRERMRERGERDLASVNSHLEMTTIGRYRPA